MGLVVGLDYFLPVLLKAWEVGSFRRLVNWHEETVSLTSFGKWFLYPPHRFMSDGLSGDFVVFYSYLSDLWVQILSRVLGWEVMHFQAVFVGPGLAVAFWGVNFWSCRVFGLSRAMSALSALLIQYGSSSKIGYFFDRHAFEDMDARIHLPGGVISIASSQSWGWLLFLPVLAVLYRAYQSERKRDAILLGVVLGVLFQTHLLTFINVAACVVFALVCWGSEGRAWVRVSGAFLILVAIFLVSGGPTNLGIFIAIAAVAVWALFRDRIKWKWYLTVGLSAIVTILPFVCVLILNRHLLDRDAYAIPSGFKFPYVINFFIFFMIAPLSIWLWKIKVAVDRRVWSLLVVTFGVTFLFGFNQYWGWKNHPYRFLIHLIFPLAVLSVISLKTLLAHQRLRFLAMALIGCLLASGVYERLRSGHLMRGVGAYEALPSEDVLFLQNLRKLDLGPRWLALPDFAYPRISASTAAVLNYVSTPAFFPDFRYVLDLRSYAERVKSFCREFPIDFRMIVRDIPNCEMANQLITDDSKTLADYGVRYFIAWKDDLWKVMIPHLERKGWKLVYAQGSGVVYRKD